MTKLKLNMENNEYWWVGAVNEGHNMPYSQQSTNIGADLNGGRENDQFAPLLLSSKGRYVWSDEVFKVSFNNGEVTAEGIADFELQDGFGNLRGAYLAAMKKHFPFNGKMPDKLFWTVPQYNTWIELGTEQTEENILNYAKGILENGLPAGILMIDGGWQEDYGMYEEFNRRKIPNPKALTDELHKLGFKVMVWVSPIISSAGPRYKELRNKGYLVKDCRGDIAVRRWWSGYSAVLDFSNPDAVKWMHEKLDSLMERYGVDGFKFDAGDKYFYEDDDIIYKPMPGRNQTAEFNKVGEKYKLNEYRAAWKFGGRAIVARLHDKYHTWNDFGLNTLIPHTIMQGLCGYAYCCPDMVGGGILDCFNGGQKLDEELFVRWAQANALMGMMQMSISPWRVLNEENTAIVKNALKLHTKFGEELYALAVNASKTGEPVIRHMAYEFPDEGFETVNDQFMAGSDILAAPVLEKGRRSRSVILPKGSKWVSDMGKEFDGGQTIEEDVPLERLVYYRRKKED